MKAKDTVIKETPQISMSFAQLLSKYMALDDFQKIVRADRQAQAEISFKAGIREVAEWIPKLIEKIKNNMWEDDWGIKGVLYEDMLDSLVKKLVKEQLKEWGL